MTVYIVYGSNYERAIDKCDSCGKFTNYRTTWITTEIDEEGQFVHSHECKTCRQERCGLNH